jgi:methylenetetrahydrofolate reductase (NADPH)
MTKITDKLAAGRTFSFEFFPPKSDDAARELEKTIGELQSLGPSFVSVTYGAGGSTRERTRDIVIHIERDAGITAMAHLTCIAHTREQLVSLLGEYQQAGIENILALAGDPPTDTDDYPHELDYACDLVELVHSVGDFSVGVAAHPELHPRSNGDRAADRRYLAAKLARADFGITQFFFEAEHYLAMIDELAALGCDTPVLPGIMPVTNAAQIKRFAQLAGAAFPVWLAERIEAVADDPDEVRKVGIEVATELSAELLEAGAPGLHFYTLNRSTATREIWANLGL